MRSFAALLLATACGRRPAGMSLSVAAAGARASLAGPVALWSWFDLPDDPRAHGLSGIAWNEASRTLWAVQDQAASLVALHPDPELKGWSLGSTLTVSASVPLDLEGLAILGDGFILASESGPRLLEVDRQGSVRRELPLPDHFAGARANKSLESLTLSPDGHFLFTTSESALGADGPSASRAEGTRLRILRMTRGGAELTEHAYVTDRAPHAGGDYGVADLAALSREDLLVLERGWTAGTGNTVRVYRTSLRDASTSCLGTPELRADTPAMAKTLLVDLATLTVPGLPAAKQEQDSPLLDNFEGLALGPRLRDGRSTVLLVSDDNAHADQFARIVVLAVG